jgi:hypothetical protein
MALTRTWVYIGPGARVYVNMPMNLADVERPRLSACAAPK